MEKSDVSRADGGVSVCPSFSVYCSDRQSAASRAVYEVLCTPPQPQLEQDEDEFGFAGRWLETPEDDFEFEVLRGGSLFDGEIGRDFPIFDCDVAFGGVEKLEMSEAVQVTSVSLGKLMMDEVCEEREGNVDSSSSSEEDEADRVASRTYRVWKPRSVPELFSPGRCKKSKSTGSCSKRWKLRDLLLRRSNSEGKDSIFLTPSSSSGSSNSSADEAKSVASKSKPLRRSSGKYKASAHEFFYLKNRGVKEERKRTSYLPYRNSLLGFGFLPNGTS